MHNNDDYISVLKSRLENVEDKELVSLVYRLIKERYELIEADRTDTLTGLHNRRILSAIDNFSGVLMIDIDDFKSINDTYGHDVGDIAIQEVADVLRRCIRNNDDICRLGGDEFAVIFIGCPKNVIMRRAEEIRNIIESEVNVFGVGLNVSIGVAINYNNEDFDRLLKKADLALYEAKEHGKNQVCEFKPYYSSNNEHNTLVLKR